MTDTLQKLFEDTVKDVYNAEKQFLKAMPKMSKAATNPELKAAIDKHVEQTKEQVARLEQVAQLLEIKPTGKVCKAAQGLVEEAEEHLEEVAPGPVLDAALIVCAQKNEHYEITSYGTLVAWSQELGLKEVTRILQTTLGEEKDTDVILSELAEKGVNDEASGAKPKAKGGKAS